MFPPRNRSSSGHRSALFLCCCLFTSLLCANAAEDDPELQIEVSPFYDSQANIMYFVDLGLGAIRSYHVQENSYYGAQIVEAETNGTYTISFAIPIQDNPNLFVVGLDSSVGVVEWDGKANKTLNPRFTIELVEGVDIHSGSTDADGLLWISADNPDSNAGNLIWMDSTGKQPEEGIKVMGLYDQIAFHKDQVFFTGDKGKIIYAMKYDKAAKTVSNQTAVFNVTALSLQGEVGGMTFDATGNMWVGNNYSPNPQTVGFNLQTSKIIASFPIPAQVRFNYVCFGGSNMDVLYGTTNTFVSDNIEPLMVVNDFKGSTTGMAGVPAKFPITYP